MKNLQIITAAALRKAALVPAVGAVLFFALAVFAPAAQAQQQQPQTPEQREKQMYENIQKQVDNLAETLDLEDWQIFYADSILTTNFGALAKEFEALGKNRVSDPEVYSRLQDACMEKNYNALHAILNEDQWTKYLKTGAARDKKARDKRAEKREKQK